jgi:hypothetical protein
MDARKIKDPPSFSANTIRAMLPIHYHNPQTAEYALERKLIKESAPIFVSPHPFDRFQIPPRHLSNPTRRHPLIRV